MESRRKKKPLQILMMVLILAAAIGLAYVILTYESMPDGAAPPQGEGETGAVGRVQLITWNLYNFGRSKDTEEMAFIAQQLHNYDLVAIQEVSTTLEGVQAVERLDDELDRMGVQWDYIVSDPTTGEGSERYAYLWKPSRVRLIGRGWLEPSLALPIDREPYLARFEDLSSDKQLLIASFHAVPQAKKPAQECILLDQLHAQYGDDNLLILGDFNLSQKHRAFDLLKAAGYAPVLVNQKTSIKMRRKDGEHLANAYDNIFYKTGPLHANRAGVIDFTDQFKTLKQARNISDHLPVYMEVTWP